MKRILQNWYRLILTGLIVSLATAGSVALADPFADGQSGKTTLPRAAHQAVVGSSGAAPEQTSEVPLTVPAGGIEVNEGEILKPEVATPSMISETEAIELARKKYVTMPYPAHALLVKFTVPNSEAPADATIPFRNIVEVPTWIVTFTAPQPTNIAQGGVGTDHEVLAQHLSIALNAESGAFIEGFFTR